MTSDFPTHQKMDSYESYQAIKSALKQRNYAKAFEILGRQEKGETFEHASFADFFKKMICEENPSLLTSLVKLAQERKVHVDYSDYLGSAAYNGNLSAVKILAPLCKGRRSVGLSLAAGQGKEDIVDYFISNYKHEKFYTHGLEKAIKQNHQSIAEKLFKLVSIDKNDTSLLKTAIEAQSIEWVKKILPFVDARANYSDCFTHAAIFCPTLEMIQILAPHCDAGALDNFAFKTLSGKKSGWEAAKFIVTLPGVNIYEDHNIVFLHAIRNNHIQIVQFFLSLEGEIHDQYRYDAFLEALKVGDDHMIQILYDKFPPRFGFNEALSVAVDCQNNHWTQILVGMVDYSKTIKTMEGDNLKYLQSQKELADINLNRSIDFLIKKLKFDETKQEVSVSFSKIKSKSLFSP